MRTLLATLLLAVFSLTSVQAAEPVKLPQFGDWDKRCEKGLDDKEICYILQTATNTESGQRIMQVRIGFSPNSPDPVMVAILPLGAMLPAGAAFVVEGVEPLKMPFLACAQEGCTTMGQLIPPALLVAMKKGDKGAVRVMLLNKKVVNLPVSLKGFTRAYNEIKKAK